MASWNDTATRQAIESYVEAATGEGWTTISVKDDWATVFAGAP